MNLNEIIMNINYLAVLVAALSAFLIGGLWYGPLFGKAWQKEIALSDEEIKKSNPAIIFGGSFILTFISAFNLAFFLGPKSGLVLGLISGAMTGLFFVTAFLGVIYLFERKSIKLFFINGGYIFVTFSIMGLIIGVWK